jgi:hypothetical protein
MRFLWGFLMGELTIGWLALYLAGAFSPTPARPARSCYHENAPIVATIQAAR